MVFRVKINIGPWHFWCHSNDLFNMIYMFVYTCTGIGLYVSQNSIAYSLLNICATTKFKELWIFVHYLVTLQCIKREYHQNNIPSQTLLEQGVSKDPTKTYPSNAIQTLNPGYYVIKYNLFVKFSIYHTFIASLLEKFIFLKLNFTN
jgi:hypothetical protein